MAQPYRSKTGIYQLRRKVPSDLRAALGYEYKRSLKTSDPAEAKARFADEWARSEAAFALARAQASGAETLDERDLQQLAARWFREEAAKMEAVGNFKQWLVEAESLSAESPDGRHWIEETRLISLREAEAEDDDPPDITDAVRDEVRAFLLRQSIPLPADGPKRQRLEAAFREHWLRLSDLAMQRQAGNWTSRPDVLPMAPLSFEAKKAAPAEPKGSALRELFKGYSEDKTLNDGDTRAVRKTLAAYEAVIEQFIELMGDLPVQQLSREAIRQYRIMLAQLPAKGEGIRKLTARQMIDRAEAEKLPRLSAPTIRNKLRALSAVLSHGLRMGVLTENPVIAGGVAKAAAKAASARGAATRQRKDYTSEELARIFSSPIYGKGGWAPPQSDFGKAWYWLPLLMYYTGARREEIAQLAVRDVKRTEDGIAYLSILATADDADDKERGVKTESSRRMIPLHPDLLRLGLLEYAASVPKGGQLFPLLKPSPTGFYAANFGRSWARYLRDVVKLGSPASPSHGFRHTFKTLCRSVGIPEDVHDAITGHVGAGSVARDYGSMPLARMAQEIAKLPSAPLPATGG